jgi:F420H(2)-dependent quinone reductase
VCRAHSGSLAIDSVPPNAGKVVRVPSIDRHHPPDIVRRIVNRSQRAFTAIETRRVRRPGRSLGGRIAQAPVLLITTTGRRSGRRRTTPLVYVENGKSLLVVAAYGGSPWNPAWYLNLLAQPSCTITVNRHEHRAMARPVLGQGREKLWPLMRSCIASLPKAEQRTRRSIPLVSIDYVD